MQGDESVRCAQQHREKRGWWGDERGSYSHIHEAVGWNNEFIQCPARLLRVMISSPIQEQKQSLTPHPVSSEREWCPLR